MDPSALIFVALAVAWAVYLIPKALEHHDTSERARTIDRFSGALRVLARRDAVSRKETRLVTDVGATSGSLPRVLNPHDSGLLPAQTFVRRSAAATAARRRRRVALVLLLALALVASFAVAHVISWVYLLAPVALVALWLYACRRMVANERAARGRGRVPAPAPRAAEPAATAWDGDETSDIPAVSEEIAEPVADGGGWAPVSTPLPTYVSKPMAPRPSVRTIDLDSTGVWSSGRSAADSALAQQADAARTSATAATTATGATAATAADAKERRTGTA